MTTNPASSIPFAISELVKIASMGGGRGISRTMQSIESVFIKSCSAILDNMIGNSALFESENFEVLFILSFGEN